MDGLYTYFVAVEPLLLNEQRFISSRPTNKQQITGKPSYMYECFCLDHDVLCYVVYGGVGWNIERVL